MLGIGAVVAPIGATGLFQPAVTLLEPARIQPAKELPPNSLEQAYAEFCRRPDMQMQVAFRTETGAILTFEGRAFVGDFHIERFEGIPVRDEFRWRFEGVMIGQTTINVRG